MDVSYELYKVFYHVAIRLSFSAAADDLYISQSAVSQSIRLLESKLGSRLFSRHSKQVRLTSEGEILYRHVEQAVHLLKSGERSIQEIHALQQGEIHIGASDTICKYYLLPHLKQFNQSYPQIKIRITNRPSPVCTELLGKGLLDLSVVNLPPAEETGTEKKQGQPLQTRQLMAIEDIFVANDCFAILKNRPLALAELAAYPLLMLERPTVTRLCFDNVLSRLGLDLKPEIELGSLDLLLEMAKIGLGVALVTRQFAHQALHSGDVFALQLQEPLPARYLGLVTIANIPPSVAAQRFIALLTERPAHFSGSLD